MVARCPSEQQHKFYVTLAAVGIFQEVKPTNPVTYVLDDGTLGHVLVAMGRFFQVSFGK